MPDSLFSQGLSLLIYGMGSVMLFLALLVIVTIQLSALVTRFFPESLPAPAPAEPAPAQVDGRTRAIIAAAIARHRAGRR